MVKESWEVIKDMTFADIRNTSFEYKSDWRPSPFGYTHPDRDPNEMCIYCKNENTERIRDKASLAKWDAFWVNFPEMKYKVFWCYCCGAVFSTYGEKVTGARKED